jgi:hypothetical protein
LVRGLGGVVPAMSEMHSGALLGIVVLARCSESTPGG